MSCTFPFYRILLCGSFFGGRPRFNFPTGISQSCSLQRGHCLGRASMRLIHVCPHRRHWQRILEGIVILVMMIYHFS
jgi:hypothetical protein